ncbi:MAG: class A beta-lactamase-related serine hydrolase [Ignavibacteriae bacterium]|nr:class A beta-lactamase-related serine hydrolase [Ignavibacteriota bacterium]
MKTKIFMLVMLAVTSANAQKLGGLTPDIVKTLASVQGKFAVGIYDLQRGDTLFINPDTIFHAASTMKTPVMIELYRQAEAGKINLDDNIVITNEFKSIVDDSPYKLEVGDDSDSVLYKQLGSTKTVRELIRLMITVSSNLATNILIELADANQVMATMESIGANDIRVLRGVEDIKAFRQGLNNRVSARDLVTVFRALAEGKLVHNDATQEMIGILSDQQFNSIIPALLPKDVRVAHKTGNITGIEHDTGIVFLPNGRSYVLVLLSKDIADPKAVQHAFAQVSKQVYDYFVRGN